MSGWIEIEAVEAHPGDVIDYNGVHGRIGSIVMVREIGHFTSGSHLGKFRFTVDGCRDLFIAPSEMIEVYR